MGDDMLARLLSFNNVIVTSHQGFFTREALDNIAHTTPAKCPRFLGRAETDERSASGSIGPDCRPAKFPDCQISGMNTNQATEFQSFPSPDSFPYVVRTDWSVLPGGSCVRLENT